MTGPGELVVLLHGLWCRPFVMSLLGYRLRRAGYQTVSLGYRSLAETTETNADLVQARIAQLEAPVVHLVGHSLGGRVILKLLAPGLPANLGRVVLLGTPVGGSSLAGKAAQSTFLRPFLGQSFPAIGCPMQIAPSLGQKLGIIAGIGGSGLVGLFAHRVLGHTGTGDGLVLLDETRTEGVAHKEVRMSHGGLLISRIVADEVAYFLRYGCFSDEKKYHRR